MSQQYQKQKKKWFNQGKLQAQREYEKRAIKDCKWLKDNMRNVDSNTWLYRKAQWDCLVEFFDLTEKQLQNEIKGDGK